MLSSSQHAGSGQGQGQNLSGPYGHESDLRAGLLILIVFFIAPGGLRGHPLRARNIGIRLKLNFTKICTEGSVPTWTLQLRKVNHGPQSPVLS
jgi:hypothetical protein